MSETLKEIQEVNKNDTLATMVAKQFWVSRNKFKIANKERLAKMAQVPGKEEKYVWNLNQNMRIRDRILKNDVLPLHEYTNMIKKFSPEHQESMKNAFTEKEVNTYVSNLSEQQILNLNTLPWPKLIWFLKEEVAGMSQKSYEINEKMWFAIKKETAEQIANLTRLMDMQDRLIVFMEKNKFTEYMLDKDQKFINKKEQEGWEKCLERSKEQKKEYAKLVEQYGGEEWADAHLRFAYILDSVSKTESYKKLSEEEKKEFGVILTDYYVTNQSLDIDMSAFGFETLSSDASQAMIDIYSDNTTYKTLVSNLYSDRDVEKFFDAKENKISTLVPEKWKDKKYYTKLLSWFPELDKSHRNHKISEYLNYLNDDMTIKEDASAEQKKILSKLLPKFQEQSKSYENKLLAKTNTQTQNIAIEKCVSTLEKFMDVDINEKQNIIEQLEVAQNKDAVSKEWDDLVLHIDGTIDGKKVKILYNLVNWKVSYKSFLAKKTDTDQSPISINAKSNETEITLVTLPTLWAFVDGAKTIDYAKIIDSSHTIDDYSKNFTEKLQQSVKLNTGGNTILQKDVLKTTIIKDMIMQDIFALSWKQSTSKEIENWLISKEQYPQMHGLYNYLYKSLEYYSLRSIDQLQSFQKNIANLLQYKNTTSTQSIETVMKYKETNKEMFVLQALTHHTTLPLAPTFQDQWPEEKLLSFLKCFQKDIWGMNIIDIEMMNDYFTAATWTNKENNNIGNWNENKQFATVVNAFETQLSGDQASVDMEKQLNE